MIGLIAFAIHGLTIGKLLAALALLAGINVATKGTVGPTVGRTYAAGAAAMAKGLAVVRGADDNTVVVAGANVQILGFVEEANINVGQSISIVESGECHAQIGAAVTAGQMLVTDGNGRLIPSTNAGDNIVAQALSSNTTSGDFIVVKVVQYQRGGSSLVTTYAANGAIPAAAGVAILGGAGARTMTLPVPATDNLSLLIQAGTAAAHTVTTPANKIQDANATDDTVTFAHVGDLIELRSIGGLWQVVALRGATLSEV